MTESPACKLCGSETELIGSKQGKWKTNIFPLCRCPGCGYACIVNPLTDYAAVYSEGYYAGLGADPLVDYRFEMEHPELTIRLYEWRGILRAVRSLVPVGRETAWLDFGCGNGGLVRYCREQTACRIVGLEEGAIRHDVARTGIPLVDRTELEGMASSFDVVTAIEVFEHLADPREVFEAIHRLLKPGGLLFYTTGNALPHRRDLTEWSYVIPEVHISFYEPETLRKALQRAGFRPEHLGYLPGFTDIIRFKILKNLRIRRRSGWESALPWGIIARATDAYFQVSGYPVAWACK